VVGGALGVLLPHDTYRLGLGVISGVVTLVGIEAALVARGRGLLPILAPRRGTAGTPPPLGPSP
jgi:hypothetical protein